MKPFLLSLLCLIVVNSIVAQSANCPPNIDFETGQFTGWECSIGYVSVAGSVNQITLNPSVPTMGRHQIMDSINGDVDPYGGFPTVCPYGGRYSVKLGNNDINNEAEGISYTFQIPPNADTFALTYYYAVVFEDPQHSIYEQPRFFVSAYDVATGQLIDCASYNYISNGSIPGFLASDSSHDILYKEWTPSSIDFTGLAGRMVRLDFKTADCTLGGHFGYAYLDVGTGCGGVMAVGAYCIETNSVTLNAPYGFQNYTWYNNNYTTVIGNTRTVTLSPPPSINSIFHVDMIPYPGYGCRDTADAILTVLPVPDTPSAPDVGYCQYDLAAPLEAFKEPGFELLWYTSATGGVPSNITPTPSTNVAGVFNYWVTQKRFFGCESRRKKITITISPTPNASFTVNDKRQCQNGNNFIFTNTSTNTVDSTRYKWDFGDGNFSTLPIAQHRYTNAGSYSVTLTVLNPPFCERYHVDNVEVLDKPIASFSFPPLICENQTLITLQNNSYSPSFSNNIASCWWQMGSNIYNGFVPTPFLSNGGNLPARLVAKDSEGCISDTIGQIIPVHFSPVPKFKRPDALCNNEIVALTDLSVMPTSSTDVVQKWNWTLDNNPSFSTQQHPSTYLPAGLHHVILQTESDKGCKWRTADSIIMIHPKPSVSLNISDSCVYRNIIYTAGIKTPVPVQNWLWNFGYGINEGTDTYTRRFGQEDNHTITLIGKTEFGCKDTLIRRLTIYYNRSKAERDTIAAIGEPVYLITSKNSNMAWYQWSPAEGLNSTTISNPIATNESDQLYELKTLTQQGCDSYSKVFVRRIKGPELYVARAFTPNSDGTNDVLHIIPVGIKSFDYFCIYNRIGNLIFKTTDYHIGWDGTYNGINADPANYVWMAKATDYKGGVMMRKGNVILIR